MCMKVCSDKLQIVLSAYDLCLAEKEQCICSICYVLKQQTGRGKINRLGIRRICLPRT